MRNAAAVAIVLGACLLLAGGSGGSVRARGAAAAREPCPVVKVLLAAKHSIEWRTCTRRGAILEIDVETKGPKIANFNRRVGVWRGEREDRFRCRQPKTHLIRCRGQTSPGATAHGRIWVGRNRCAASVKLSWFGGADCDPGEFCSGYEIHLLPQTRIPRGCG